jgi:5-methylcytosine-specific restriction endonuclease McrA
MWGRLVLEHVVPIYRGGDTTLGNCVPACSVCNNAKGPMPPEVFLAMYPKRAIEFTRRVLEANGLT